MDEAKRKEREELRKKIDPKILERVAKTLGYPIPEPATSTSQKKPNISPLKPSGGTDQLSELKQRIKRREEVLEELNKEPVKPEPKIAFIVYDPSRLQSAKMKTYLTRMNFHHCAQVEDLEPLISNINSYLENEEIDHICFGVFLNNYRDFYELLLSSNLTQVREKLPVLLQLPIFVFLPENKPPFPFPSDIDPKQAISMQIDPEFNRKKVFNLFNQT